MKSTKPIYLLNQAVLQMTEIQWNLWLSNKARLRPQPSGWPSVCWAETAEPSHSPSWCDRRRKTEPGSFWKSGCAR